MRRAHDKIIGRVPVSLTINKAVDNAVSNETIQYQQDVQGD
jgi:hypothetical protein